MAAAIGYLGAAAWVSFPFMGARLLFVLPFYLLALLAGRERRPLAGNAVCAGILLASLGSLSAYFGKEGFLNQGYLVPFGEMARRIQEKSTRSDALLLADGYNTDPLPLLAALGQKVFTLHPAIRDNTDSSPLLVALEGRLKCVILRDEQAEELAAKYIREERFDTIWHLRNTNDISPGSIVTRLESEAAERYSGTERLFVPYSTADRWAARLLGRAPQTHHYRLTEFRKTEQGP